MENTSAIETNQFIPFEKNRYWTLIKYLILIFGILGLISIVYILIFWNKVNIHNGDRLTAETAINQEVQIVYNKRIVHNAKLNISPSANVETDWKDGLNSTTLTVRPVDKWKLSTKYQIEAANTKSIYSLEMPAVVTDFTTQKSPKVASSVPKNDETNIAVGTKLSLNLDSPNSNIIDPAINFDPPVPHKLSTSEDKFRFEVTFDEPLKQGTSYTYNLYNKYFQGEGTDPGKHLYGGRFTTLPKLSVASLTPGDGAFIETPITVTFDQDVDKESVEKLFSIAPAVDGKFSWDNERTLKFTPSSPLAKATRYNISVKAGAKGSSGSFLESDYSAGFATIGHVTAWFSPGWNSSEIRPNSAVRISFNQEVDHTSAQNSFFISPNVSGGFTWSGNTMIFTPSGQGYLTVYEAGVRSGVKSAKGLDSIAPFSTKYTTETPITKLAVPFYRQQHNLSCELAALRMALALKGSYPSESELIAGVAKNGPYEKTADNHWGNPYLGFVGSVDGNGTTTGYGVYWDPIADLANRYRSSHAFTGGNLQTLTSAIDRGSAVVIWGAFGSTRIDWTDISTGQNIYAVKGEHVRTVYGYRGHASNPSGFYIQDPIYGSLYWSVGTLLSDWGKFGNAGVIVE